MRPEDEELSPGFMVVHGNHPESLRDLMLAWIAGHPLAPLEDEVVLVQSNGVAQWLKLSLAADRQDGGIGIAAALRTQLPSQFLWEAYRAVLGREAVPAASPFDKAQLVWRLLRLLPQRLAEPVFAPLARFLERDTDARKLHQLAERIADLFDQYQVYRADWLAEWAAGTDYIDTSRQGRLLVPREQMWQPQLWRALLKDVGAAGAASSRAEVHRRFLLAARDWTGERPAQLPRRVCVFGVSSLPQQALEVLAALARFTQVLLTVHNPCEHDWSHIVADQDLLRSARMRQQRRPGTRNEPDDEDVLHLQAQPLLAAWGKQGRDFIRLLDLHDERESYEPRFAAIGQRIDVFEREEPLTLLRQLQDDIRDLRPLAETRAQWPAVDASADRSIEFHVAHGPQREVEILHDQLLAAFAADPTLRPRDVIVMVPDIATYAAHVQAVFGLVDRKDPRHIPYALADRGQRQHDPLLVALEKLLALPTSRLAVSDVLDLLEVPALRERFGIEEHQLPLLHRWIAAARVRWGLHAQHRASLELPQGLEQNSWAFGLRRMLLGYAVGAGETWEGIAPMDEIGGLDAALLGPLVGLLNALEAHWQALAEPAPPAIWGERLRALLAGFFEAEDGSEEGFTLLRLEGALQEWLEACEQAALREPLPLAVVRDHWLARMEQGGLNQPFFGGGVTFASLMPMRAIPFRWIALLGMNDGDYPRSRVPMDFDLMGQDWRPGDRSRREDDRYLFLEALLSAREHLHVSWVGRSIRDNEARPPSVLLAQLRDHIAAGWRLAGDERGQAKAGRALVEALTVAHRLQPFHPSYFDGNLPGLFSYAGEWRASLATPKAAAEDPAALPPQPRDAPLTVRTLASFVKDPVRGFFHERLGIRFRDDDPVGEDQEPFALNALENWQLQDALIQAQKAAVDAGVEREPALQAQLDRLVAQGELPLGHFAAGAQQQLAEPMARLFTEYQRQLRAWPRVLPDEPLDYLPHGASSTLRLDDWLSGLRAGEDGSRARLLLESSGVVKEGKWRHDKLLPHWVAHLAGHVKGEPLTTVVLSKAGTAWLKPLDLAHARACWDQLLRAWDEGLRRPLPFAVLPASAWMKGEDREAARACYEDHDPDNGKFAERQRNAHLGRAFTDFEALWAAGEFAQWTDALLKPMADALGTPPKEGGAA
ncbi:exodeoxyribonuclease V subunit gamma [Ramlibacter agri]|uniref:exodeoxyribonuclease V subunit gamma n=1 Tax=Ramlibacter agri TaxID=2728837 RepID=UPI001981C424